MTTQDKTQQGSDRRQFPRRHLDLLVQCRFESMDAFLADRTVNISEGGCFLRSDKPRAVGTQLYFQLLLSQGTRLVEGLGRVVRVVEPNTAGVTPGMAVEFVNLDENSRELIRTVMRKAVEAGARPA
jgi:type IV pilus assembly protein PilZ